MIEAIKNPEPVKYVNFQLQKPGTAFPLLSGRPKAKDVFSTATALLTHHMAEAIPFPTTACHPPVLCSFKPSCTSSPTAKSGRVTKYSHRAQGHPQYVPGSKHSSPT